MIVLDKGLLSGVPQRHRDAIGAILAAILILHLFGVV